MRLGRGRIPRRAGALAACTVTLASLGGCGAQDKSAVDRVEPPFGSFWVGAIHVGSPVLVRSDDGKTASLVAGLVNDGPIPDRLTLVEMDLPRVLGPTVVAPVPTPGGPLVPDMAGGVPLPVSRVAGVYPLGRPGSRKLLFSEPKRPLPVGVFAAVTFHFRDNGAQTIPVLMLRPTGELAPYAPAR
jgi:hypothetical protein